MQTTQYNVDSQVGVESDIQPLMHVSLCTYLCPWKTFWEGWIWGRKKVGVLGGAEAGKLRSGCIYKEINSKNMKINLFMLLVQGGEHKLTGEEKVQALKDSGTVKVGWCFHFFLYYPTKSFSLH